MRISTEWLSDYIKTDLTSEKIVDKIKLHTTNVETVEKAGQNFKNIVVGKIEKITKHPDADKLVVCDVNIGKENVQIVTADLSVQEGHTVPVALDGAVLKDNFKIKNRKMRGIESQGMFCSLEEVEVEEKSEEVYKIKENVEPGTDFVEYFKIRDEIIEIEVFPNRPDLLSYTGVAKEFEVNGIGENYKLPEYTEVTAEEEFPVIIEDNNCKRYSAAIVKNIKIGKTPLWMVRRLATAGIRSINNIVDITNYVMLESGHPVHSFDLDKIGDRIVVKKGTKGEKVLLLDEKEYELNGEETLITNGKDFLAMGGIMGGELSGISDSTKNVLLEVAYFDPVNTRKSAKYHKISTDASYRFERGVDPEDAEFVMGRLIKLMTEIAGGECSNKMTDIYPEKIAKKEIPLSYKYLLSRAGTEIKKEEAEEIIKKFGFEYTNQEEGWIIKPDTKRPDLVQSVDMVEEITRIFGYDRIPAVLPSGTTFQGDGNNFFKFKNKISEIIRGNGYHEIVSYSFMNINNMWAEKSEIKLLNPLSAEYEYLRPLTVYGVLESVSYNYRNQNRDVKLFEIAHKFEKDENGYKEVSTIAIAATGKENPYDYTDKRDVSYYTLKGITDSIFEEFNIKADYVRSERKGMLKSQTADIFVEDKCIGFLGLIDGEISDKYYSVKDNIYIAEIDAEKLFEYSKPMNKENKKIDFPAIKREYSFIVPTKSEYREIKEIFLKSGKIVESVNIFDIYKGKGIDTDKISITVTATFRAPDRTLTDDDVNKTEEKFLGKLNEMGIYFREK